MIEAVDRGTLLDVIDYDEALELRAEAKAMALESAISADVWGCLDYQTKERLGCILAHDIASSVKLTAEQPGQVGAVSSMRVGDTTVSYATSTKSTQSTNLGITDSTRELLESLGLLSNFRSYK